jgi:hypothetical protein
LLAKISQYRGALESSAEDLDTSARSHGILHTDRNLLSFTIVGIHCMVSACAFANDWDDVVNRFSISRYVLTSHGRFPHGCAMRRYAPPCPWARRSSRSTH